MPPPRREPSPLSGFVALPAALFGALLLVTVLASGGRGPRPDPSPIRVSRSDGTGTETVPWAPTTTAGGDLLVNRSNHPVTLSFAGARTSELQVDRVDVTASVGPRPVAASRRRRRVLPTALPAGRTKWHVVWGIRTVSPGGGWMDDPMLRATQDGHSWIIKSEDRIVVGAERRR